MSSSATPRCVVIKHIISFSARTKLLDQPVHFLQMTSLSQKTERENKKWAKQSWTAQWFRINDIAGIFTYHYCNLLCSYFLDAVSFQLVYKHKYGQHNIRHNKNNLLCCGLCSDRCIVIYSLTALVIVLSYSQSNFHKHFSHWRRSSF